jgi:LmbE family N-acetylglucosaminyl deacetylase
MRHLRLLALSVLMAAPSASPAEGPRTLLAVFAHPDDETLVAPLLAAYARRGVRVRLVVVTDGEKGTQAHAGIPAGPELAKVRAEEARCSCRALGIDPPILLGFKDGELGKQSRPPWGLWPRSRGPSRRCCRRCAPTPWSRSVRKEPTATPITGSSAPS